MRTTVAMRQARENLADLVNRVAYGRERISLSRQNKPVAVLVSIEDAQLLEALEAKADLQDLEEIAARGKLETVSWEDARKELGL